MAFPTSVTSLPRPGPATYMDDTGFEGDLVIDAMSDDLEAVETKVGTGASTPTAGDQFAGTGTGTSAWRKAPACILTNTAAQSIADSTVTAITFDTEALDTEAMHSTSVNTSRVTCVTAGRYAVSGSVQFASNAVGQRQARILVNGTALYINGPNPVSGNVTRATCAGIVDLAATDYVELAAFQSSGGALNVDTATNSPRLAVVRIG